MSPKTRELPRNLRERARMMRARLDVEQMRADHAAHQPQRRPRTRPVRG